ncbi:MAG: sel1 repeat family protein [Clostridia bacterium]|nr:sel1 repeat family protein [Clostridia bacterium]
MPRKKMVIDINRIKSFVGGQIRFKDLINNISDPNPNKVTFVCSEPYYISLEDIISTIEFFIKMDLDYDIVIDDWFDGLYWYLGDAVHIPELVGESGNCIENMEIGFESDNPFFTSDQEFAKYVLDSLYNIGDYRWDCIDENSCCCNELKKLLQVISNYSINKGKPHDQWILTKTQKINLIYYYDEKRLITADSIDQQIYKKILIELAEADDINALKTLGYACYGDDNPIFTCDWDKSRDCFLRLMDIAYDQLKAQSANTLGYIYYYGRCNNGIPQYEEAYKYFSLAAFYGFYEARYKVADMIRDGKGIFKNEEAAFRMYMDLFDDNYTRFLRSSDSVLNDVALRLASCYQHGTGTFKNLMTAYSYYLIARLAIDERMQKNNFFGLTTVSASIRSGLSEVRNQLGDKCRNKVVAVNAYNFFNQYLLTDDVRDLRVKIEINKNGTNITFTRLKYNQYDTEPYMLLVYPTISYCKKTTSVKFFIPKECKITNFTENSSLVVDKVKLKNGEIHLYHNKKLVLSVDSEDWQIKAERCRGSKMMHQFVSIQFEPGGKTYDYLCDGMDVITGDKVVIPSMNGPKEVLVCRVFQQSEADAPIEIVRYKSVLSVIKGE